MSTLFFFLCWISQMWMNRHIVRKFLNSDLFTDMFWGDCKVQSLLPTQPSRVRIFWLLVNRTDKFSSSAFLWAMNSSIIDKLQTSHSILWKGFLYPYSTPTWPKLPTYTGAWRHFLVSDMIIFNLFNENLLDQNSIKNTPLLLCP